jgi:hypothetical protein
MSYHCDNNQPKSHPTMQKNMSDLAVLYRLENSPQLGVGQERLTPGDNWQTFDGMKAAIQSPAQVEAPH